MLFSRSCTDKMTPQPCAAGAYSSADGLSCDQCPKGFYCPTSKTVYPLKCANGTYQNQTGQQVCLDCPAGHRCPIVDVTPEECANGYYSTTGIDECLSCIPGHR